MRIEQKGSGVFFRVGRIGRRPSTFSEKRLPTPSTRRTIALLFAIAVAILPACNRPPSAVRPPDIDAAAAAAALIQQCDADGDLQISREESLACPGIHKQFEDWDVSRDGKLSREEARARITPWTADGVGVMRVGCLVTMAGKPLSGAEVLFEPEPCLSGALQPARGTTNQHGQCSVTVDPADMPASQQRVRGVQPGLYQVKITHETITIPDRYNAATTLGQEVSSSAIGPEGVRFELTSTP